MHNTLVHTERIVSRAAKTSHQQTRNLAAEGLAVTSWWRVHQTLNPHGYTINPTLQLWECLVAGGEAVTQLVQRKKATEHGTYTNAHIEKLQTAARMPSVCFPSAFEDLHSIVELALRALPPRVSEQVLASNLRVASPFN